MESAPTRPVAAPRKRSGGFSLAETVISIGVVVALLLPALALLTNGAGLAARSGDLDLSARIARDALGRIRALPKGGGFELDTVAGQNAIRLELPPPGGATEVFASFGANGEWIRAIGPEEYSAGLPPREGAVYLLSVRLAEASRPGGKDRQRAAPLYRLALEVEYPAPAPVGNREQQRFSSLLSAP